MIKELRIRNFKSFSDAKLPLSRVTFLIGANASGKSNALVVLRFAGWMGHGDSLDDIERKLGKLDSIRGGVKDLFRTGRKTAMASDGRGTILKGSPTKQDFTIGIDVESGGNNYRFQQTIKNVEFRDHVRRLVVFEEELGIPDQRPPLFQVKTKEVPLDSDGISVAWNNFKKGGKKPIVTCSNRRAIFQQMKDDDRFGMKQGMSPVANAARTMSTILDNIFFVAPETSKMRGYVQIQDGGRLDEDGGNLSAVIFDVCKDASTKKRLLSFIRSIPEQNIQGINFVKTSANDVMVALKEGFGAIRPTPASLLSDGTLRVLSIGAVLFSSPSGATVVIEEVDNGVHPSRAENLVKQIYEIAESRDIQVVMTTHNPALMDAVPKDELPNVLCSYRDPKLHVSDVRRLGELPQFLDLAMGSLGDAATDRELERFVTDKRTEKDMQKQRVAWLKNFMAGNGGES